MPSALLFWEEFQALGDQKPLDIEKYTILNKRNSPPPLELDFYTVSEDSSFLK